MSGKAFNRESIFGAWMGRAKRAAAIMVLATVCIPWSSGVHAAAAQEDIRVVIFADLGSKYKATVPAVTLKSSGGLSVGQNSGGSFQTWMGLPDSTARFSVDSYRVKVLEGNEAAAIKAAQALQRLMINLRFLSVQKMVALCIKCTREYMLVNSLRRLLYSGFPRQPERRPR